jgi:S1-C subfamily serine protease
MSERKKYLFIILSSLVVFGFFLLGMGVFAGGDADEAAAPTAQYVLKDEGGFNTLISEVSNSVMPAVVHIDVTGTVVQQAPDIPFFREFFGPTEWREMPIQALGSGVLIDDEGHIIIIGYDGEGIETTAQLRNLVAATDPGTEKPVTVLRDGEQKLITVEVGKLGEFRQARLDRESELMGLT